MAIRCNRIARSATGAAQAPIPNPRFGAAAARPPRFPIDTPACCLILGRIVRMDIVASRGLQGAARRRGS